MIERLRELLSGLGLPWKANKKDCRPNIIVMADCKYAAIGCGTIEELAARAEVITETINALPELLDRLESLEVVLKATNEAYDACLARKEELLREAERTEAQLEAMTAERDTWLRRAEELHQERMALRDRLESAEARAELNLQDSKRKGRLYNDEVTRRMQDREKAAIQLEAMTNQRDLLQARVEELEQRLGHDNHICTGAPPY